MTATYPEPRDPMRVHGHGRGHVTINSGDHVDVVHDGRLPASHERHPGLPLTLRPRAHE